MNTGKVTESYSVIVTDTSDSSQVAYVWAGDNLTAATAKFDHYVDKYVIKNGVHYLVELMHDHTDIIVLQQHPKNGYLIDHAYVWRVAGASDQDNCNVVS